MRKLATKISIIIFAVFLVNETLYAQTALNEALSLYKGSENLSFDAARGKTLWNNSRVDEDGKKRTCHTCHTNDLTKIGKHIKTEKEIDPMALSVNKKRFTKLKKIKKWFKRNCKWTFGRECTSQEKGDILTFLSLQ
ncbi:MAG: DUF1924 domain-containing protein [Thiohalomonadales bacterium]